jgi:hypothetical protein
VRSTMRDNTANLAIDITSNTSNLTIIARNAAPKREGHYPQTWMVYSAGQAIRVDVAHDHASSHPYVEDKQPWG